MRRGYRNTRDGPDRSEAPFSEWAVSEAGAEAGPGGGETPAQPSSMVASSRCKRTEQAIMLNEETFRIGTPLHSGAALSRPAFTGRECPGSLAESK